MVRVSGEIWWCVNGFVVVVILIFPECGRLSKHVVANIAKDVSRSPIASGDWDAMASLLLFRDFGFWTQRFQFLAFCVVERVCSLDFALTFWKICSLPLAAETCLKRLRSSAWILSSPVVVLICLGSSQACEAKTPSVLCCEDSYLESSAWGGVTVCLLGLVSLNWALWLGC